ncbi:sigma factor-like helix-turn-helix DNA-binding protein [Propionimicrobium sp. PCR01-08-3]|uniref:sigma factor-like helix-turn-helix DNA-binding protein n=1 Tax=Propionimicrobium sp. PCR01-08-3 TaxID=3052086 RepID=UPI00333FC051
MLRSSSSKLASITTRDLATAAAAPKLRDVVRRLHEAGLSVTDAAAVLGVSRGRISQLAKA